MMCDVTKVFYAILNVQQLLQMAHVAILKQFLPNHLEASCDSLEVSVHPAALHKVIQ